MGTRTQRYFGATRTALMKDRGLAVNREKAGTSQTRGANSRTSLVHSRHAAGGCHNGLFRSNVMRRSLFPEGGADLRHDRERAPPLQFLPPLSTITWYWLQATPPWGLHPSRSSLAPSLFWGPDSLFQFPLPIPRRGNTCRHSG